MAPLHPYLHSLNSREREREMRLRAAQLRAGRGLSREEGRDRRQRQMSGLAPSAWRRALLAGLGHRAARG
jgi:hypothetical protein